MSNAVVPIRPGATTLMAVGQGQSVLGETQARIPIGGKIRAGIKVLTSAARNHPKASAIYQEGVLAGEQWDQIEKRLREQCGFERSPLTPKNVPYFTVRQSDFHVAGTAERIMQLYGEDRGDGVRLYRLPIVLPLDTWLANMPHGLKEYSKSEMVHWSDYGADGNRYCYTRGNVEIDPRAKRAKRVFGGRPVVLRNENNGQCIPDACPEYQAGKCKLSGGLVFYIPGIPGSSVIQLPTTSFYSLSQWRQQMEMVGFLRGRLSGLGPDGKPVFWLAKTQEEVSMIDPDTGRAKKVTQYLVKLEADIDMSRVFRTDARPLPGSEAAAMLGHVDAEDVEPVAGDSMPPEVAQRQALTVKELRLAVNAALSTLGINIEDFKAYAAHTWHADWGHDAESLASARAELMRAADDLPAYLGRIAAVRPITESDCPF
jgi:hypothetical protein